jgi:hypothetical protein
LLALLLLLLHPDWRLSAPAAGCYLALQQRCHPQGGPRCQAPWQLYAQAYPTPSRGELQEHSTMLLPLLQQLPGPVLLLMLLLVLSSL